jgi:L-fuconolactonase
MYRADGPVEMRSVDEVEFVAGIAAMSASGGYGWIKVAEGIVGYADLALGDRVEPALEALIGGGGSRFAGVRYSSATMPTRPSATAGPTPHLVCMPGPKSAPGWRGSPRTG